MRCGGRGRCARAASHIVDVIPRVAVRPWVLALPAVGLALRRAGPRVLAAVVRAFVATLFREVRWACRSDDAGIPRCAAVSCVLPLDAALEPGLQVHVLVADGVFVEDFRSRDGPPGIERVAVGARRALREMWGAHRWGPLRLTGPPRSGPMRRIFAAPKPGHPDPWAPWTVAEEGRIVVGAGPRLEPGRREHVFEWARAVGRPVLDPGRVSRRADGWLVFEPSPVLEAASAAVASRRRVVRLELSPQAVAARLADPGCPGRRIRFHGLLVAGREARDSVLPRQLGLGTEPGRVIRPRPMGRRHVLRPPPLQRVSARAQPPEARPASTRRASESEGAK